MARSGARFLQRVSLIEERVPDFAAFPYALPLVKGLSLAFDAPVTSPERYWKHLGKGASSNGDE